MENKLDELSRRAEILYEKANSISHGIGFLLSVPGLIALVYLASVYGTMAHVICMSIYGASLTILYAASTLYHSFRNERLKSIFQVVDHCAIYLLIAGTYTPVVILLLKGEWGTTMAILIWSMAAAGIIFKLFFTGRFEWFSTITYVLMGCIILIAIQPLTESVPTNALWWLLAGGVAYIMGVVFYAWHRLPFHHMIWHLFVMTGSVCHYMAIFLYALPQTS